MRFFLEDAERALRALGGRFGWAADSDRSSVSVDSRTSGRPSMLPWFCVADSEYVRASLVSFDPAVEARRFGASDRERVESDSRANPTRVRTAVADRQGDHAVRHAGKDPDGKLERAARVIDTDHILARETERFGGLRAHERGVVPGELGEGIGKLLQPPVVRESAVVKRRRGQEHDLQSPPGDPSRRRPIRRPSSAKDSAPGSGTTSGSSLPERNPSCRTRFHFLSNSSSPRIGVQVSRTMS